MHRAFSDSIPDRIGIFNKEFLPETRRYVGVEPQSLVSVLNIPGLNSKSLRSAYDVNAYVLSIVIPPSGGDFKPGSPLGVFR